MLHFYTFRIKEKCVEFFCIIVIVCFSCSLVKDENIKKSGFYTLQVTSVFFNFPQLKQINKIKNRCEYCDPPEL